MGRTFLGLATALIMAACGQATPEPASTTTSDVVAPPTTKVETTTSSTDSPTTVAPAPVDICSVGKVWEAEASYTASCFLIPVTFTPSEPGWRSSGSAERWVSLRWVDPDEREWEVDVGIIAYQPNNDPREVIEAIDSLRGINVLADPEPINLVRVEGVTVDAEGEPANAFSRGPCESGGGLIRFAGAGGGGGNTIVEGVGRAEIGVGFCVVARLWALDIDGLTVTVLAAATDPQRHDDAIAVIEALLKSMTVSP